MPPFEIMVFAFIKKSNQLFAKSPFPINTTSDSV